MVTHDRQDPVLADEPPRQIQTALRACHLEHDVEAGFLALAPIQQIRWDVGGRTGGVRTEVAGQTEDILPNVDSEDVRRTSRRHSWTIRESHEPEAHDRHAVPELDPCAPHRVHDTAQRLAERRFRCDPVRHGQDAIRGRDSHLAEPVRHETGDEVADSETFHQGPGRRDRPHDFMTETAPSRASAAGPRLELARADATREDADEDIWVVRPVPVGVPRRLRTDAVPRAG